ncbi:MAG: FG-GAP-like repeat-containing protein [Pirellulaceae bacterium]
MAKRKKKREKHVRKPAPRDVRWRNVLLTAIGIAVVVIVTLIFLLPAPQSEAIITIQLEQARLALQAGRFPQAEELAKLTPESSPQYESSRLIAGEAATRDGRPLVALEYYASIVDGTSPEALLAVYSSGELYRANCQLQPALAAYTHVLEFEPDNPAVHERAAFLLGASGQVWESVDHHLALVRLNSWTLDSLAILADVERSVDQGPFAEQCSAEQPDDMLAQLALANTRIGDGQLAAARPILERVVDARPNWMAAQAMLGLLLDATSDWSALAAWSQALPGAADAHPTIWYIRGIHARNAGNIELAAGCFAQSLVLAPEYRQATYQFGQMLAQLKDSRAEVFVERARQQAELGQMLDQVLASRGASERSTQIVTESLDKLGRGWEAWAWAQTAQQLYPAANWPQPIADRWKPALRADLPRTSPDVNPIKRNDFSSYLALARSSSRHLVAPSSRPLEPASTLVDAKIRFEIEADSGIALAYENGGDPATPGSRMFEQTGGGVGVLDFDNDGWPDLYFTQGSPWKTGENTPSPSAKYFDHLYRNVSGQRFVESSALAGVQNLHFAQGVAVGDFDADGFADLYVANIGTNRLWRNNGDGTFSETSDGLSGRESHWTTSAVMVDLNGDQLADIFDVNYLQGNEVFTLICDGRGCSPKIFEGCPDQLWINQGDGAFELLTVAGPAVDSKGLGVLAVILGEDKLPSLFVANDQVPNFLLSVEVKENGALELHDDALLKGVAFNDDGLPMACMGIASDDIDQNGLVDLLVTNFSNESNSLYLQDALGMFADATQASGMKGPSYPYVGWGTQFLDADLDSLPDLVVVNGNVDEDSPASGDFRMRPQFFQNTGNAQFQLREPVEIGSYFAATYAARGLAKLDWNRDGRMDFVVSNIGSPGLLVSNTSSATGQYLNIELRGTVSAREPIGATVHVTTDQGAWTKQLVAGDGFQAANQRMLQFGLGNAKQVTSVEVRWPSGLTTRREGVELNTTLSIVEGRSDALAD